MYGSEYKEKNIINSINDAFQDGLNNQVFNKTIDNILKNE